MGIHSHHLVLVASAALGWLPACETGVLHGPLAFDSSEDGFTNLPAEGLIPNIVGIFITDRGSLSACRLWDAGFEATIDSVEVDLYGGPTSSPVSAGTFRVASTPGFNSAGVSYYTPKMGLLLASSGTLTVTSLSAGQIMGTFTGQLQPPDAGESTLSGTFEAPLCAGGP